MACVAIDEAFTKESGRFGGDIYKLVRPRSFWFGLIPQEVFPAGIGDTINNLTAERAAPTTYNPWRDVVFGDGQEGGACIPPVEIVKSGETIRNYNLQEAALKSEDTCIENLRGVFDVVKRMGNLKEQLTNYSREFLDFRFRHEYLRITGTKVVVSATPNDAT